MHTSRVFAISMKEKSAENVMKAYLSGILAHNEGSIAILSNNGTNSKIPHSMRQVTNSASKGHSTPKATQE